MAESGNADLPIVDCHTHVVSPDLARYPLNPRDLSGEWYKESPASAEDLTREMQAAGVTHAVLVQGVGAYTWDNDYAADAAAASPDRFVSVCAIDGEAQDAPDTLARWLGDRGMQGVRLFAIARTGRSWLSAPATDALLEVAAAHDAHVVVTILPGQLGELEALLERHPTTPVSLDHCAFALAAAESEHALFALARFEGLMLKLTPHVLDAAGEEVRSVVGRLVDGFGAERLLWGSDYCQTYDRPYGDLVRQARHAFGGLAEPARDACLSGNARRIWPSLR